MRLLDRGGWGWEQTSRFTREAGPRGSDPDDRRLVGFIYGSCLWGTKVLFHSLNLGSILLAFAKKLARAAFLSAPLWFSGPCPAKTGGGTS